MKRILQTIIHSLILLLSGFTANGQIGINSPAGVKPTQHVEIYSTGNFIVQGKYRTAEANPETNTYVVSCSAPRTDITVQAGTLMDPSSFSGYSVATEYTCYRSIVLNNPPGEQIIGIEITFLEFDLGVLSVSGSNDYLEISNSLMRSQFFNGNVVPGRMVVPGNECTVYFRRMAGAPGGQGFRLQWRALYEQASTSQTPFSIVNTNQIQFNTKTGALITGMPASIKGGTLGGASLSLGVRNEAYGEGSAAIGIDNVTGSSFSGIGYGRGAVALGYTNFASGDYSAAIGENNTTVGNSSLALGYRNRPSGEYGVSIGNSNASGTNAVALGFTNAVGASYGVGIGRNNSVGATNGVALGSYNFIPSSTTSAVAIGHYNTSSAFASMAIGTSLVASGTNATAAGYLNIASGNYSTAMGTRMNTNGKTGSFMIGDSDPLSQGTTFVGINDQFVGRFLEGYYLMTSGNSNPGTGFGAVRTGVQIGRGQNSWASISDSTKKERFLPIDHVVLLKKISRMKLTTWNYKGQQHIRHYGPMAQDFYAAFGQDGLGRIGCDTLIYSHDFAGVTFAGVQALIRENEQLKTDIRQLSAQLSDYQARLFLIEKAVLHKRERITYRKPVK